MVASFNLSFFALLYSFSVICMCHVSDVLCEAGWQPLNLSGRSSQQVPTAWEGCGVRVAAADAVSYMAGGWQCPLADSGLAA